MKLRISLLLLLLLLSAVDGFQLPSPGVSITRLFYRNNDADGTHKNVNPEPLAAKECHYLEDPESREGRKPAGAPKLAAENFVRQASSILDQGLDFIQDAFLTLENETPASAEKMRTRLPGCLNLSLPNEAVKEAERIRESKPGGKVKANVVSRGLYDFGCLMLDSLFDDRPIQRFWFLETIARIPYFSYTSMLHFYESLGWWRGPELRKVHHAEEWNELHHLLIMEALGGNTLWSDRFLGYHAAIAYYWLLNGVFLLSPRVAYQFMELLESHAVDTYATFVQLNCDRLKVLPAPQVAKSYYTSADLYMFDDFQVSRTVGSRRPPCDNMYDVFSNICDDEAEHVKTMQACQEYVQVGSVVVSPHATAVERGTTSDEEHKRKRWLEWAESFQDLDARADDSGDFDN